MNFQQRLRHYREKAGYKSAKEFAEKLGIGYTTYVAYENKDREPRYKTLCKIAHLLNITPNDLLGFEDDELHRYIAICNSSGNKAEIKFTHDKQYIALVLKDEDSSINKNPLFCTVDEFSQIMKNALSSSYEREKENMAKYLKTVLNLAIHKATLEYIISTNQHSFTDKDLSSIKSLLNKLP